MLCRTISLLFFFLPPHCMFFFFFFSSRRRHTRLTCDWSSDVCSSDLFRETPSLRRMLPALRRTRSALLHDSPTHEALDAAHDRPAARTGSRRRSFRSGDRKSVV